MMLPASLVTPLEDNGKTPKRYTIQISLDESPVIVIYRIHDYERTSHFPKQFHHHPDPETSSRHLIHPVFQYFDPLARAKLTLYH